MSIAQFYPFTSANMVNGQSRILFSQLNNGTLTDQAVPTSPASIFAQQQSASYAPVTTSGFSPWVDVGGTTSPPEYGIARVINQWRVQQQIAAVRGVPSEITRTVKFQFAEFNRADLLSILENAGSSVTVNSASGHSAFTEVPFGQFTDLNQYRVAIAVLMGKTAGNVIEADSTIRDRMIVQCYFRCSVDANQSTASFALGEVVAPELTLQLYPEPGQGQNQEQGAYFIEAAGTIS